MTKRARVAHTLAWVDIALCTAALLAVVVIVIVTLGAIALTLA